MYEEEEEKKRKKQKIKIETGRKGEKGKGKIIGETAKRRQRGRSLTER